jgi:hypothetical protein
MENEQIDWRDSLSQDIVLMRWDTAKKALVQAKEEEMKWRKYVVQRAFPAAEEGTNKIELGNGYELKAVIKYNYKLIDNNTVEKCLDQISKIGNKGSFIADRLVSWTPSFLVTEYRALQEADTEETKLILKICNEMLVITEAAPTVTISEPKGKS